MIKQYCDKCGSATIRSNDINFKIDNYNVDYDVTIPFTSDPVIDQNIKDHANNIFYLAKDMNSDVGDNIIDDIWGLVVYAYKGDNQDVIPNNITDGYDFYNNLMINLY